jgi:DNA-binding NtrC family response regulator
MMKRILTIDDDDQVREVVRRIFEKEGCTVYEARTGELGLEFLSGQEVDAVLLDLEMPGMGGIATLEKIRSSYAYLPVVILTGYGQVRSAIEATRLGADDYLEKPASHETIVYTVRKAIENRSMIREISHWRENNRRSRGISRMIAESPSMKEVVEAVRRVAPTDYTVLITGETGTGKDVIATYLHEISRRADKIFIPVDCGAIPDNLIESELFGHERGAFTGADKRKEGVFELADGGTLFLDELANLSLSAQAKFLRVLQDRKVKRLGSPQARDIDVRVVVATNADVEQAIGDGRFREDLYFRLNEFRIQIPPLRERKEDLGPLAVHFAAEISEELNRTISLSPAAMENSRATLGRAMCAN